MQRYGRPLPLANWAGSSQNERSKCCRDWADRGLRLDGSRVVGVACVVVVLTRDTRHNSEARSAGVARHVGWFPADALRKMGLLLGRV